MNLKFLIFIFLLFALACGQRETANFEKKQSTENQSAHQKSDTEKPTKPASGKKSSVAPDYVFEVLEIVKSTGEAPEGYVGGRNFQNREKNLPQKNGSGKKIFYREWDVFPKTKGKNRGAERLVTGDDGSAWYTKNHYKSFVRIE